jgi:hypothetical protein
MCCGEVSASVTNEEIMVWVKSLPSISISRLPTIRVSIHKSVIVVHLAKCIQNIKFHRLYIRRTLGYYVKQSIKGTDLQ